jgi:hypothetical protein
MPITFSTQDVNHTNAMVVTVHINRWDVTKILIDNGSQAEILFLMTFEKMGFNQKQLKEPVRVITLPVSFGTPRNPRTEYITFDVIDMLFPDNAIFGLGLLNTFEAALHLGYLYLKILATFGVISVFGSQQEARNIKKGSRCATKMYISAGKTRAAQHLCRPP